MKALILAAGYATRLYPLTKEYPKSLLEVKGRPIIDYIVSGLQAVEAINEIFVVTNSKFFPFFSKWQEGLTAGKMITLVDDLTEDNATRRGAIGDIDFTVNEKSISEDLLVVGGDNLFDGSLKDFVNFTSRHLPNVSIGIYDIQDIKEASRYGVVRLDNEKRIVDFKEKPEAPESTLVAMCLYYFPKEKLGLMKEYKEVYHGKTDATGFYIDWLRKKEAVYGVAFGSKWYDIGDYKFYGLAQENF